MPPPRERKNNNSTGKSSVSFPVAVQTNRAEKKRDWRWPVIEADTVVIGADLAAITTAPIDGVQVENYPGARFQHFTDMLKDGRGKTERSPKNLLISIGLNDRNSDPNKTSCRNLKTLVTWIRTRYPTIKVGLVELNCSEVLPKTEQSNIDCINKAMSQLKTVTIIPKLEQRLFKVTSGIQWSSETADTLLRHWISYLN